MLVVVAGCHVVMGCSLLYFCILRPSHTLFVVFLLNNAIRCSLNVVLRGRVSSFASVRRDSEYARQPSKGETNQYFRVFVRYVKLSGRGPTEESETAVDISRCHETCT